MLAFWLVRVVIHHSRATRGTVTLASTTATHQAWLIWIAVCWVGLTLAQLAITVAGNLGWLPLTGITFPFASFGAWSLLANTFFLSLAISLPRKTAQPDKRTSLLQRAWRVCRFRVFLALFLWAGKALVQRPVENMYRRSAWRRCEPERAIVPLKSLLDQAPTANLIRRQFDFCADC
jgi:hypothetical protein